MTHLHTCRTCAVAQDACEARAALLAALRGLGVRSAKHRCANFAPRYQPGNPITVKVRAWMSSSDRWSEERAAPLNWYPGHFIRLVDGKALVFVKPGTQPVGGDDDDEALETNSGYLKVPLSRVEPSTGERVNVTECVYCGAAPGLGQSCARDPQAVLSCYMRAEHPSKDIWG